MMEHADHQNRSGNKQRILGQSSSQQRSSLLRGKALCGLVMDPVRESAKDVMVQHGLRYASLCHVKGRHAIAFFSSNVN